MHKVAEKWLRSVTCKSRFTLPFVISFFCVKILAVLLFSRVYFFHTVSVTFLLILFRFWEVPREAAHAKVTRKGGRPQKKTDWTLARVLHLELRFLVVYACAAARRSSENRKNIRRKVTAQAEKQSNNENTKKGRMFSRFFSK